jgi:cysteine desulfurase
MQGSRSDRTDLGLYFDHAATTPPAGAVLEAMTAAARDAFANPSSQHVFGERAKRLLTDAHEFLRGTLCAARIVLTSGGTEADVLGVTGAARARPPGRVLVGAADHAAVLAQRTLLGNFGHRLETMPVTEDGAIDAETLYDHLGKDVRVVSLLHGHNELGTLLDLEELVGVIRHVAPEAHIHLDLVQAYGKIDFDLDHAGVDSAAVSGHKLHGPRGVGFLALSSTAKIVPMQAGGGQEEGLRGGTENVAGIVGLATAADLAFSNLHRNATHMERLTTRMFHDVQDELPRAERLGDPDHRLPHVLSMRIPGVVGASLQQRLAARGVAISTGSACHDGDDTDNHVLAAIGLSRREAREVVRLSVSPTTTEQEACDAADALIDEAEALLASSVAGGARRTKARSSRAT